MDNNLNELVKELKDFLNQTRSIKTDTFVDHVAKESDLVWEASRFFATIMHKAKPLSRYRSYEQFQEFKKKYETLNSTRVDEEGLFQKFWLRNILGFIVVSNGISSLAYHFNDIKAYKNEIEFWIEFQNDHKADKKRVTDKTTIDAAAAEYETRKNIQLNNEGIYFKRWASIKEDSVEYADIEIYFKQYIDHWNDFSFLWEFEQTAEKDKLLLIKKDEFKQLHTSFKKFFSQIPTAKKFINEKILKESGEYYGINFYNTGVRYWEALHDKIGGICWELIANDKSYKDDKQRLKDWLTKLMYWPGWPDLLTFTTKKSAVRFLDAAFELVINDSDITSTENEFAKICLDSRMSHDSLLAFERTINSEDFTLNNSDAFELLESFNRWEKRSHTTYLYSQDSRNFLAYLINILVNYDTEFSRDPSTESALTEVKNFRRIISLLHSGLQKPYLVWEVTRFIIKDRPEVIPYLIIESELETLSFIFLDNINFFPEQKKVLVLELWKRSTRLFLQKLTREESPLVAKKIFQLYRSLNKKKYEIPYNRGTKEKETEIKETHDKKEALVLGLIEDSRYHKYMINQRDSEYFLPIIYKELTLVIINHASKPLYHNGTVQLPIMQWDAVSWLLKVSTYWKYHDQKNSMEDSVTNLTTEFLRRYLESIEVTEVKKYNYSKDKDEMGLPLWSEKIERLHFIDWIYPIYFINKKGLLNQFLSPRIYIENTSDQYHEKNRFSADKLRTHIGVLLQVLRKLLLPVFPYGFEKEHLRSIKANIERQIIDYLKNHLKDQPEQGKIDLFDFNREWRFQTSDKEALFPQIARAINWFSDKDSIINAISESGDISKLLTLLDLVKSEGIKLKLIAKIKDLDIQSFLEKYSWIPEVQYTVTNLSNHPELLPQIEEAILFWKQRIMTRKNKSDYQLVLYKAELIVAYFKKSEKEIEEIKEPEINYHGGSELRSFDYKLFYKGLLFIQSDPEKSHKVFDNLVKQYAAYPSFALNRMIAKINFASSKNDLNLYREALEEWKETEKEFDRDTISFLEPELTENIMTVLNKIGEYEELDERYKNLDLPDRMQPEVLQIVTQSLTDQKRITEALQVASGAKTYHQFSDIKDIQFVTGLENNINQIDNLDELKTYYHTIFTSEPKKMIKIFPEDLNGRVDLNQFLVKEILLAADKLLDKIMSIEEIADENKYNDLIELALDARINPWGWQVGAQSRAAFSGTGGKQPGERDLPIMNKLKQTMMVCEAFIFRDATRIKQHLEKVFNYHHKKDAFAILVYELSKDATVFQNHWNQYTEKIVPSTSFPPGYSIIEPVKDVSKEFGFDKSAIKICSSEHESGTILYHIFLNINYKLPVT